MITANVTGKLGRDPELKTTKSGKVMARFSIASSQKKGDEYATTWVDVLCFDEMAEMVSARLSKGDRCTAIGKLNLEQYEKRDGTPGCSLTMMADEVGISLRYAPKEPVGAGSDDIPSGW